MLNDQQIHEVAELLFAQDFYQPAHKVIFQTLLDLTQQLKRIDMVTLQDELEKKDQLIAVGGVVNLIALQEDIPAVGMLLHHARNY